MNDHYFNVYFILAYIQKYSLKLVIFSFIKFVSIPVSGNVLVYSIVIFSNHSKLLFFYISYRCALPGNVHGFDFQENVS